MTRILALSSQVAHGHVGLSAAVPALHLLGHRVTALPTVFLSNHPGWPHVAGMQVPPDRLGAMIDALDANGWLGVHDAMLTGYLPSAGHVALAADLIDRVRAAAPGLRVIVDPVLGDTPRGLYVEAAVAAAIRDHLLPRADVLTPNRFEFGWLTGVDAGAAEAVAGAAARVCRRVVLTSAPLGRGRTGVLDCAEGRATAFAAPLREGVPNGVGDVLAALIAAGLATGRAMGHLQALIEASLGADHLRIVGAAPHWTAAPPVAAD